MDAFSSAHVSSQEEYTVSEEYAQAIWTYSTRTLTTATLIVRPNATDTTGDFTASGAATLHEAVNDESDTSYIYSGTANSVRTLELLESTTVRATRTLAPTGSVSEESFTLTAPELASITDWSDINIRITEGGTPCVLGFPTLQEPAADVTIKIRHKRG
jgi:hypothetical protein